MDEDTIANAQRIANIVGREVVFFDEGADSPGGMHNGYYNPLPRFRLFRRRQNAQPIILHGLSQLRCV